MLKDNKQVTIRLSEELWKAIAQAALDKMTSRKALIKTAIEEFLKKDQK